MDDVLRFVGKFDFLSNFYSSSFVWDNILWPHAEAAYQAAKTLDRKERLKISQMKPVEAKRYGKTVVLRLDWEEVKYDTMYEIVNAKFTQNPDLLDRLLATGYVELQEGNYWKDRTWGVCPIGSGKGKNWLGQILMSIRDGILRKRV